MSLDNVVRYGELLDCYGRLLTERQQTCMELYYNEDLSLAETAEKFGISRQAVHDTLRHAEEQLDEYESVLHMAEKRRIRQDAAQKLLEGLTDEDRWFAVPLLEILSE